VTAVALSGLGTDDDVRRSKGAGFADHLIKPPNVRKLQEVPEEVPDRVLT
jgi:hypothetical protein